jgi:hypothetical protein
MTFSDGASICFNNVRRGIYQALFGDETAVEVKFPRSPTTKRHVQGHAKHVKDGVLRLGLLFASCAALCILFVSAVALAQSSKKPLINDDVVQMVKGGLPENTIINAVQAQDTRFDVSAAALIKLKQQGVSQQIMSAMIASAKKAQGSSGAAGSASQGVHPASTSSVPGDASLPLTAYRLNLLTIRDNPELLTDTRLAEFTREQVGAEITMWKELGSVAEVQSRRQRDPVTPSAYEWQKFISQQPAFARGPLLDVFLRPDADWSFVQHPDSSVVMAFVFSRDKVEGRQPEFAAHDLLPIARQHLELAASRVSTSLWVMRSLPAWQYDFSTQSIRFPGAAGGKVDILSPVFDPESKPLSDRTYFDELPAKAHADADLWIGSPQNDLPEVKPGFPSSSPTEFWREKTIFLRLPSVTVLAFDRQLRISSIPLASGLAEQLQKLGNTLKAKVYITAERMEQIHQLHPERVNGPTMVLFARLQKVEILNSRDEIVKTLLPEQLPAPAAIPPAPAPANAGRPPSDTKSFQEHQDEVKAQNRRNVEASQEKNRENAAAEHAVIQAYLEKSKACRQRARDQVAQNGGDERPIFSACMKEK